MLVRSHKLFLGRLSSNVSAIDLLCELPKFGTVPDLWIAKNSPGFAFVQFKIFTDAEKAVCALDGVTLCGFKLRVDVQRASLGDRSRSFGHCRRYIDSRGARMSLVCHFGTSLHRGRSPPPGILSGDQFRYPYDHLVAFHSPDMLNAAVAAAAAGLPYQISAYPSMFPLPQADDVHRVMKYSRRISLRGSPFYHRRSRSPMDSRSRNIHNRHQDIHRSRDRRRPSLMSSWQRTPLPPFSFTASSELERRRHRYDRSPTPLRVSGRRRR
ncbi:RNA-binding protein Rsf1 [Echinococcus granulosus]|uniref:RNA-binding protein Rsf1 n=1 Tax=Echinococcus granulosus TaxID=6210 RepID=W6USD1_ECHGR|nr:RNA-binding protein Rsf1 [Echinococcus granulosus]EUB61272.1 RNA-binding protein Rsf1 [Echinococcus granulosus]